MCPFKFSSAPPTCLPVCLSVWLAVLSVLSHYLPLNVVPQYFMYWIHIWCKHLFHHGPDPDWLWAQSQSLKIFGLLPDRAWIWLDFPDLKHDYIKGVYRSDMCFAGHGPRTCDFHGDCSLCQVLHFLSVFLNCVSYSDAMLWQLASRGLPHSVNITLIDYQSIVIITKLCKTCRSSVHNWWMWEDQYNTSLCNHVWNSKSYQICILGLVKCAKFFTVFV